MLLHHTDCGMLTFPDDEFTCAIQDETGVKPPCGRRKDAIRGFAFAVATGRLDEVPDIA